MCHQITKDSTFLINLWMLNGRINCTEAFGKYILSQGSEEQEKPLSSKNDYKEPNQLKVVTPPVRLHSWLKNISCHASTINTSCIRAVVLVARHHNSFRCIASFTWDSFQWIFTFELSGFTVPASFQCTCDFFIHKLQILTFSITAEFQELSFLLGICPVSTKSATITWVTVNKQIRGQQLYSPYVI